MRTFLETVSDFHALGKPVVADRTGGLVGLSLLAFGGVGGLSHGVTVGERFDSAHWRRPRGTPFGSSPRVYLPLIDMQLSAKEAAAFFALGTKVRAHYACRDTNCCPRGLTDMVENPARHFLYQRAQEVAALSQIPDELKPASFVEQHLRSTTDRLVSASMLPFKD